MELRVVPFLDYLFQYIRRAVDPYTPRFGIVIVIVIVISIGIWIWIRI